MDHFQDGYAFNCKNDFRLYRNLSKDHINVNDAGKMRNHLAINILSYKMLNLMEVYQSQLADPSKLDSTVLLLEQTAIYVDIFSNSHLRVESVDDVSKFRNY